jgi:hypothetical protein
MTMRSVLGLGRWVFRCGVRPLPGRGPMVGHDDRRRVVLGSLSVRTAVSRAHNAEDGYSRQAGSVLLADRHSAWRCIDR